MAFQVTRKSCITILKRFTTNSGDILIVIY